WPLPPYAPAPESTSAAPANASAHRRTREFIMSAPSCQYRSLRPTASHTKQSAIDWLGEDWVKTGWRLGEGWVRADTLPSGVRCLQSTSVGSSPGKWCSDPSFGGQAVRAGRELVVTSSVLVSGTTVRRQRARISRPR